MASSTERLVIVTIVTCFLMGLGSTLKLETTPEPFNVFAHKQINITCIGDGPSFWTQDVVLMEIGRQDEKPIATVNAKSGRTDMGPNSGPNMQAVGHIDKEATHSFLTVIINKPGIDDAGTYICRMFYVDEEFQIEEETALVNVTVDNQDMVAMVTYLIERVSALENSSKECEGVCNTGNQYDVLNDVIARQNQTIESQGQHINLVNDVIVDLNDTIDSQSRRIKSQDHQIDLMNDIINNLSDAIKGHQIESQDKQIESQDKQFNHMNDDIINLNHTIEVQGHQIKSQDCQIKSQDHQIDLMNDVITNLSDAINGHDLQIQSQGHHVTVLGTTIREVTHNLTTKDQDNTAMVSDIKNTVTVLSEKVSQLWKHETQPIENDTTQCAFSISYNKAETFQKRQILNFTDPITNIGQHYNTDTGIFTAPRDGVYVFHLVASTWTAKDMIIIKLFHNSDNNTVARLYAKDANATGDQSSVSSVLSLAQGDIVYPVVWRFERHNYLASRLYSVFSGFLLKAS